MGGEREVSVQQKESTKTGVVTVGGIRIHEKAGEIHFHDDANKLKVAIPAAVWMAAFQVMEADLPAKRQFVDPERKTVLYVSLSVKPKKPKDGVTPKAIATLRIKGGVDVDAEFALLHKFTFGN